MNRIRHWICSNALAIGLFALICPIAVGHDGQAYLSITRTPGEAVVSWTGPGTLQSAPTVLGPWEYVIDANNPHRVGSGTAQQFFRVMSRWGMRRSLLEPNSEMSVAALEGKIYVIGGYPSSRVTVATVQVYDIAEDRWSLTTPLPQPLNHAMPAVANGRLYVIGGQTDAGTSSFVNSVYEFDPATARWTTKASMPTARSSGAAAVIGDLIYVAGGRPPRGQDFAVYDPVEDTWTRLPNMPTGRNHLGAAAIDGKMYVAGGRLGSGFNSPMTAALEVFDPASGTWSARTPLREPRGGLNGIAVRGCFFVFGGEGPNGMFHDLEMYAATEDRWHPLEALPIAVHGVTGAAFADGWIHLPGGGTEVGGSSGSTIHQVVWIEDLCP